MSAMTRRLKFDLSVGSVGYPTILAMNSLYGLYGMSILPWVSSKSFSITPMSPFGRAAPLST